MGFLASCWELLLHLASHSSVLDGYSGPHQQPLDVSSHHGGASIAVPSPPTTGPSFQVPGTDFVCHYPKMRGYRSCNTPHDRSCWLRPNHRGDELYDIHTEYDTPGEEFIPTGITREYWLEVTLDAIAPDGYLKELGQVFNHTYPGPHLQGCWGDTFKIHVTNKIDNLGTTIHWHGIRQLHTNQQDGVNGVTQCPIAYNETYTYTFHAQQYGHTWYHSHYQTQYSDGVAAPLTIYGPSSSEWDETFEPIMMQDWVHENTSIAFRDELASAVPIADGLLLGGLNSYLCSPLDPKCCSRCNNTRTVCDPGEKFCCIPDPRCTANITNPDGTVTHTRQQGGTFTRTFVEGKRYLLKLINASADAMFIFTIDDHDLEVIAADLVPIKPYITDHIFVAIGQRYQVIVTAKPRRKSRKCLKDDTNCNYWIRTRIANGCGNVAHATEETGIIRYNQSSILDPTTIASTDQEECRDEDMELLKPIVPWNASDLRNSRDNYTFPAALSEELDHGAFRWELTEKPLFLNYSDPSLLNVGNDTYFNNPFMSAVHYTNPAWNDGFVYLVIDGGSILNVPGKLGVPAAHPIHLHGHDFVILAQVDRTWNGKIPKMTTDNPTRRDTALLYAGGYLALAFKLDNPGVWLVHCHIAWHASSGLALQIIEREDEILPSLGANALTGTRDTCAGWHAMDLQYDQEDSGI